MAAVGTVNVLIRNELGGEQHAKSIAEVKEQRLHARAPHAMFLLNLDVGAATELLVARGVRAVLALRVGLGVRHAVAPAVAVHRRASASRASRPAPLHLWVHDARFTHGRCALLVDARLALRNGDIVGDALRPAVPSVLRPARTAAVPAPLLRGVSNARGTVIVRITEDSAGGDGKECEENLHLAGCGDFRFALRIRSKFYI